MNLPQYSRSSMPAGMMTDQNPEMAQMIQDNPVFASVANEVVHEREVQAQRWFYVYNLSGSIAGQQTLPFNITIEQGTDFKSLFLTASAFSYNAAVATSFPIPNSAGLDDWAGRGLSLSVTDTRSGRTLTSGFVALELLGTPGYGMNFQNPFPLKYFWYRNSKIRFDIRNRDVATRTHYFEIALSGYKILTPQ